MTVVVNRCRRRRRTDVGQCEEPGAFSACMRGDDYDRDMIDARTLMYRAAVPNGLEIAHRKSAGASGCRTAIRGLEEKW